MNKSGNLLKLLRGNFTQEKMAERYGVSQQTWASWESGRTAPPDKQKIRLEWDFGVPMEVIFYKSFDFLRKTGEERENAETDTEELEEVEEA